MCKKYFRFCLTSIMLLLVISSFGQKQKELLEQNNNFITTNIKLEKRVKDLVADSIASSTKIKDLEQANEKFNTKHLNQLNDLEYRCVGHQKWANKNITEGLIKELVPEIKEANEISEWEKLYKEEKPAYCFHKLDPLHNYGVLLNVYALKKLNESNRYLASDWTLPKQEDFDTLSLTLSNIKPGSLISLITSNNSSPKPNWKKEGIDIFDLQIAPLSYRRNTSTEWFGETSASFYCFNSDDFDLKSNLKMAEINETDDGKKPVKIISKDLTDDFNNFGIYVRLIKK